MPEKAKKKMKASDILFYSVFAALLLYVLVTVLVPRFFIASENPFIQKPPYHVGAAAEKLHGKLFVADMHADSLMQKRDLMKWKKYGHVDIPRMRQGNVALQIFTAVTKVPSGQNYDKNAGDSDLITVLAIVQKWPIPAWFSLKERAVYMADRLTGMAVNSGGKLKVILTAKDLDDFVKLRNGNPEYVAGVLGIEGVHALEGKPENIDLFFKKGYRIFGLTHFFDNEAAGSTHGMKRGGLTTFGTNLVRRMNELRVIPDLAHASEKTANEVLDLYRGPVIVSHTGVKGVVNNNRNISDALIRRVAKSGGVIGIGFWEEANGGNDVKAIVRSIKYVRDLVGADYVGLGSDFDGTVKTPFDASGMALITEELLKEKFSEAEIAKIMGGNVLRVLRAGLPR